jgi:hypothetical protein
MNSMHTQQDGTPTPENPAPIDVEHVTERTRRTIYEIVVRVHFTPTPEELQHAQEDPENHWIPTYTADDAGLAVHHLYGRWVVAWRSLEEREGEVPVAQLWTVLRIARDDASPYGLVFLEV